MTKYDDHRTFLQGILDAMSRTEVELSGRLDELKDQKRMIEDSIQALNVYEHITDAKEA